MCTKKFVSFVTFDMVKFNWKNNTAKFVLKIVEKTRKYKKLSATFGLTFNAAQLLIIRNCGKKQREKLIYSFLRFLIEISFYIFSVFSADNF